MEKAYRIQGLFLIIKTDIKLLFQIALKVSKCLFSISVLISVVTNAHHTWVVFP